MNARILSSLSDSASDFQNIVWPEISKVPLVSGGILKPVEAANEKVLKNELDILAGIDAWQLLTAPATVRGIASRVQWGNCYKTFTIRVGLPTGGETEFQKRRYAIENKNDGHLYPHITIQAFLECRKGRFLAAAAIKTEDLIKAAARLMGTDIQNTRSQSYGLRCSPDKTTFLYMRWDYLIQAGYLARENRLCPSG